MASEKHTSLVRSEEGVSYLYPFVLVTSLFFLWGFSHGTLDVLNKHFQEALHINKAQSGWIQFAFYGGYAIMAIPAGLIMKRFGFKKGIVMGLFIAATGAFLFYPATISKAYPYFLIALFILACGLTCLETAANPYSTILGPKHSAARRINLSQSANGLGWIMGPLVGGALIFGLSSGKDQFSALKLPYIIVGTLILIVAFLFIKAKLPEIKEDGSHHSAEGASQDHVVNPDKPLYMQWFFVGAVVAQFLYVAAQTGINSFFINYVTESIPNLTNQEASRILAFGGMGLFFIGRISGSYLMQWFKPNKMLAIYALFNVVLMLLVILELGWTSVAALFITYLFMSIMFPTIFALGIRGLGEKTKLASSFLVMAVAGGAICPLFMGWIADHHGMAVGFWVPLVCFSVIALYGLFGYKNSK